MMRGLTALTCAAPRPSLSSAPGRYASSTTSDTRASLSRISIAWGRLRSSTRLRLLRLSATKLTLSPSRIGGVARPMSPCGGSTWTTYAPMPASSGPARGPAMKFASSMTRIPASGFGMSMSLHPEIRRGRGAFLYCASGTDALRLLYLQSRLVDDVLVHRNLARDAGAENLRPLRNDGKARFHELLPDVGAVEDQGEFLRQPIDHRLWRPGRRVNALEGIGDGVLHPELFERRHAGKIGPALPRGHGDGTHFAGVDQRHQGSDVSGVEVDLAGEHGGGRRPRTRERDVQHVDPGPQLEDFTGEIRCRPGARARPIELAGIGLCLGDQVRHGLDVRLRRNHECVGRRPDHHHRDKVLVW